MSGRIGVFMKDSPNPLIIKYEDEDTFDEMCTSLSKTLRTGGLMILETAEGVRDAIPANEIMMIHDIRDPEPEDVVVETSEIPFEPENGEDAFE